MNKIVELKRVRENGLNIKIIKNIVYFEKMIKDW